MPLTSFDYFNKPNYYKLRHKITLPFKKIIFLNFNLGEVLLYKFSFVVIITVSLLFYKFMDFKGVGSIA